VVVSVGINVIVTGLQAVGTVSGVTIAANADVFVTGVSAQGQVGNVLVWGVVDDSQTPNWQNVGSSQSVTWTQVLT
jgi:hypothetical protein